MYQFEVCTPLVKSDSRTKPGSGVGGPGPGNPIPPQGCRTAVPQTSQPPPGAEVPEDRKNPISISGYEALLHSQTAAPGGGGSSNHTPHTSHQITNNENLPYSHPQSGVDHVAPPPSGPARVPAPSGLLTGISRLDRFFANGFSGGQITLLEGPADFVLHLTSRFAVSGVTAFDRPVIIIDGGNTADPYGFASVCRRWHLEPRVVLARIFIARAFTVYQLDTLLAQTMEERLNDLAPAVVIVSALNSMYLDPDVNWDEARGIFQNDMRILRKLTERHGMITLITNFGQDKSYHAMELGRTLRKMVSQRFFIKARSRSRLRVVRNGIEAMDYTQLPPYQCSLDEFIPGGVTDG